MKVSELKTLLTNFKDDDHIFIQSNEVGCIRTFYPVHSIRCTLLKFYNDHKGNVLHAEDEHSWDKTPALIIC